MAATFFRKIPRVKYEFEINGSVETHDMINTTIKYILSYQKAKKTSDIYKFAWLNDLRPDSFADTYYNTDSLYWLGLFSGGIYDIHNELPKNDNQMVKYLFRKYKDDSRYTQYCTSSNKPKNYESVYAFAFTTINHYEDADGDIVDASTPGKIPVTVMEYEDRLNESKRYINIIDVSYGPRFEAEFNSAMNKLQAELEEND